MQTARALNGALATFGQDDRPGAVVTETRMVPFPALTTADEIKQRSVSSFQYSSCFHVATSPITKEYKGYMIYMGILAYTVRLSVLTDDGNRVFHSAHFRSETLSSPSAMMLQALGIVL